MSKEEPQSTGAPDVTEDIIVDELGRRKWDKTQFAQRARSRIDGEKGRVTTVLPGFLGGKRKSRMTDEEYAKIVMEPLQARKEELNLEENVQRRFVVTGATALDKQGGFFCEICECLLRDSASWLNHLNGIKHQKRLGMSMKVVKSSADEVKDAFKRKKKEREEAKQHKPDATEFSTDLDDRIQMRMDDDERKKKEKKERKKQKKVDRKEQEAKQADDAIDPDMAAMMGFSGFGK